jgi:transposase
MPRSYSYDLRTRVIKDVNAKMAITEISKKYSINRNTIYEWKHLQAESGDIKAKIRGRTKGKWRKIQDLNKFKEFIDNNMDKTASELSMHWSEKISKSSILNYIKLIGYSYKKNFLSSQKK